MRKFMLFGVGFSAITLVLAYESHRLLLVVCLGVIGGLLSWRYYPKSWKRCIPYVTTGILVGAVYFYGFTQFFHTPLDEFQGEERYLQAVVLDFPQFETYSYSVLVGAKLDGMAETKTLLYMDKQAKDLKPGDEIEVLAELRSADATFSGIATTYFVAKGILLRGVTSGELSVQPISGIVPRHVPAYLARELKEGIFRVFPGESAGVIQALVTGNRVNLTDGFSASLERSGLSHTVAVSGMHLAFLAGMLRLLLPPGRKSSAVGVILAVILFVLVSGSTPSILRAGIMIILLQLAPVFGRERDDATALSTALFLILLGNPYAITHVGLHLSFASVLGILLFSEKIQEKLTGLFQKEPKNLLLFCCSSFSATFGAMVVTTPLVAYYFGNISLIAPISNLLTLSVISVTFAGGLIAGVLGQIFPFLGEIIAYILYPLVGYLDFTVGKLSQVTFAAITMESAYYRSWMWFSYLIFLIWLLNSGKKRVIIPICSAVFTLALVAMLHHVRYFSQGITMEVLDVGQGQSVLMSVGDHLILSDCGGSGQDSAGNLAADAIQNLGRNSLDLLILSHCHADHAGGVTDLMGRIHVEVIALPVSNRFSYIEYDIVLTAQKYDTEIWYIEECTEVSLGNNESVTLYPPVRQDVKNENETGITALVSSGENDVLFIGDMGAETEETLVATFALPDIEVLMVGHHGSKFSSSPQFLETVSAEIGVISVGKSNTYGHPAPEALERLGDEGMDIYRTDTMGTIRLHIRN